MSPTSKELLIDFADLRRIGIRCPACSTEVILDVTDTKNGIPSKCPTCSKDYESLFRMALDSYRDFFTKFSGAGYQVKAHITLEAST
jgi:hypothetical protein